MGIEEVLEGWKVEERKLFREVLEDATTELQRELNGYPATNDFAEVPNEVAMHDTVAIPFRFASVEGPLSFYSTTTVFGTPIDVTLSELALEFFYPADRETADKVRSLA